jgi:hypothetical protein
VRELVDPAFVKARLADVRAHASDAGRPTNIPRLHHRAALEDLGRAAADSSDSHFASTPMTTVEIVAAVSTHKPVYVAGESGPTAAISLHACS